MASMNFPWNKIFGRRRRRDNTTRRATTYDPMITRADNCFIRTIFCINEISLEIFLKKKKHKRLPDDYTVSNISGCRRPRDAIVKSTSVKKTPEKNNPLEKQI